MRDEKLNLCYLPTPLIELETSYFNFPGNNKLFVKRDDMTGFVLGGNKTRKLEYFMRQALAEKYDYIVTYGSQQSNHCSSTAAAAAKVGLPCKLILSESNDMPKYEGNFFLYQLYGANIVFSKTEEVSECIKKELSTLRGQGYNPYFIPGGGHGNLGTHAYVKAYEEIQNQRNELGISFDYIFHASGTGTTQAGLIIGKEKYGNNEKIIGISIARSKERGINVIEQSIMEYCKEYRMFNNIDKLLHDIFFVDDYVGESYGDVYSDILSIIKKVAKNTGILLDPTYTGKAFYGMIDYIRENNISNKNILFVHTGGIPILFSNSSIFKE